MGSKALVILRQVGEDGEPVGHLVGQHIGRIEQGGDAQALLGYSEGELVVLVYVVLVQLVKVTGREEKEAIRIKFAYNGETRGSSVPSTAREILVTFHFPFSR